MAISAEVEMLQTHALNGSQTFSLLLLSTLTRVAHFQEILLAYGRCSPRVNDLMTLPAPDTPLYNHPLPDIEAWLRDHGCVQHRDELHCWQFKTPDWQAWISLDIEELTVIYESPERQIRRAFKYSLSREDIEAAVFAGP